LREDVGRLRTFPFDADDPLVILTIDGAVEVLDRHAAGVINDDDLELWADALEMRDDIQPEPSHDDLLKEFLFELSAPVMTSMPIAELATQWRRRLASLAGP
jgi:hypothetical protein